MKDSRETKSQFEYRLAIARATLLKREPFLGFLALELPTYVVDSSVHGVETAATDGTQYIYNYCWCRRLIDSELVFVIAHELAHVAFHHALRREGREPERWNAACDYAINAILEVSAGPEGSLASVATMPVEVDTTTGRPHRIGLFDKRFFNMPAEAIYEELVKRQGEVGRNWDRLLEPKSDTLASEAIIRARGAVARALIRTKDHRQRNGQGDEPGDWERRAEAQLRGTVRWQDRFKQRAVSWGADVSSWSRPNKKYLPHGFYLPRYRNYHLPNIIFAFDTSGSITARFLGQMVAELNQLLLMAHESVVRVICCDTKVHVIGDFGAGRRLDPKIQPLRGGGGTDFRPVFSYAAAHSMFQHLVYLTDANGQFPESTPQHLQVLWLVPEGAAAGIPFGEVISLPDIP